MQATVTSRYYQFALRLNAALDAKGFPPKGEGRQNELARRLARRVKVTPRGCRKWLEGLSIPRMETLKHLADLAGVEPGWLVSGQLSPAPSENAYSLSDKAIKLARAFDKLPKEVQWVALNMVYTLSALTSERHSKFSEQLRRAAALRSAD